jgi:hypothetical protein
MMMRFAVSLDTCSSGTGSEKTVRQKGEANRIGTGITLTDWL